MDGISRVEAALAEEPGIEVERSGDGLGFTLHGVRGRLDFSLDEGMRGSMACRVDLDDASPHFEIDLRPRMRDELRAVERGEAVDVDLGDPAFARWCLVEAAPADVARCVLDAQVRGALLALGYVQVIREASVLRLECFTIRPNDARARAVVSLCVALVQRIVSAGALLAAPVAPGKPADSPIGHPRDVYRDAPIARRSPADEKRAHRELKELFDARRVRAQVEGFPLGAGLIVTLVAATMIAMSWH